MSAGQSGDNAPGAAGPEEPFVREMTVAAVREPPGEDFVQVAFLESARFYRLSRRHADFEATLDLLRAAAEEGRRLRAVTGSLDSDVLEEVSPAAGEG